MPRVRSLRQGRCPLPLPLAGRLLLICQNGSKAFSSSRKPLLTSAHPKLGWEVLLKSPRDSDHPLRGTAPHRPFPTSPLLGREPVRPGSVRFAPCILPRPGPGSEWVLSKYLW